MEGLEHDDSCPDPDQEPGIIPMLVVDYDVVEAVSVQER
jgi:hypothetical protein